MTVCFRRLPSRLFFPKGFSLLEGLASAVAVRRRRSPSLCRQPQAATIGSCPELPKALPSAG